VILNTFGVIYSNHLGVELNSKMTVSFVLYTNKVKIDKTIPIYLRIYYSNKMVQISTGLSVHKQSWNKKTNRFLGNSLEIMTKNETLKLLELKVWNIFNNLLRQEIPFTVYSIRSKLLGDETTKVTLLQVLELYLNRMERLVGSDYSPSSLQKYTNSKTRILEFIQLKFNKNDLPIHEVNNSFMMDFLDYLKVNVKNQPKTVQKHCQRITTMMNYSVKRGLIEKVPFNEIRVKVPPKLVTYLTQEEVDRIEHRDFKNERLNIIRDMFIFSVYSGFSYTELRNLHEGHTRMIDGQMWVEMIRQKTRRPYKVPLLPKCVELIERYKDHPKTKENGLLLPLPTNQKFNCYLKEIQDLCSINTTLTCHLGRRTFGSTILLRNNINIHVISQLLGHSSTNITIKSYLGSVPELMLNEFDKIKSVYERD